MKKLFILIVLLFAGNTVNAQKSIVIKGSDGKSWKSMGISAVDEVTFVDCPESITYAGKTYKTAVIGSQCWLQENLNVGTRKNASLEQTNDPANVIDKYCHGDLEKNCDIYGGLYQWAEAVQYQNGATNFTSPNPAFSGNVQGICPPGWHIPTLAEFTDLRAAVIFDGNALKARGQGTGPAGVGTNASGFSALMAGNRDFLGSFNDITSALGSGAHFWSSTEISATNAYFLFPRAVTGQVSLFSSYKLSGFSVRCLKD